MQVALSLSPLWSCNGNGALKRHLNNANNFRRISQKSPLFFFSLVCSTSARMHVVSATYQRKRNITTQMHSKSKDHDHCNACQFIYLPFCSLSMRCAVCKCIMRRAIHSQFLISPTFLSSLNVRTLAVCDFHWNSCEICHSKVLNYILSVGVSSGLLRFIFLSLSFSQYVPFFLLFILLFYEIISLR